MANQAGWIMRSPAAFEAEWDGGTAQEGLQIRFAPGHDRYAEYVGSHFGSGIVTFVVPWMFRTSEGMGLMVRGATNFWKAGAAPLDGFVESWWLTQAFTMNWKIVEKNRPVKFEAGDPVCMIHPYPADLLEATSCRTASVMTNEQEKNDLIEFNRRRAEQAKTGRRGTSGGTSST